jgi:hypothetical protein
VAQTFCTEGGGGDSFKVDEHIGWPRMVRKELKIQEVATVVCTNCSHTVDELAAAGISLLFDDLNKSCVTQ